MLITRETHTLEFGPPPDRRAISAGEAYLTDSCIERPNGAGYPRWLLWLWRRPQLCVSLLEIRSFLRRMRIVLGSNDSHRVYMGTVQAQCGHEHPCDLSSRCLHARIADIEILCSKFPWATPLDWRLAAFAWEQGYLSVLSMCGISSASVLETLSVSEREDIKPDLATQQPTKRDPSNPPPSRA